MTPTKTSPLRVLVVDDHELTRCTLKLALSRQSYIKTVEVASNGKEAIAKTEKCNPDLIVMDLHMPVMDGWTASNYIKTQYPGIKIVAYSAAEGGEARATENGAMIDAFCDKGACTQSLLETIRNVV
jgi:two-component system, NarL family, vancomycin resistance associated response regulator VraR